jgi:hypothetical protein
VDGVCCDTTCGLVPSARPLPKVRIDGICGQSPMVSTRNRSARPSAVASALAMASAMASTVPVPNLGTVCAPSSCVGLDAQNNPSVHRRRILHDEWHFVLLPFVCSGSACLTSCTTTADCAQGIQCVAGNAARLSRTGCRARPARSATVAYASKASAATRCATASAIRVLHQQDDRLVRHLRPTQGRGSVWHQHAPT